MTRVLIIFLLIGAILSCKEPQRVETKTEQNENANNDRFQLPEYAKSSTIYEVNIRQFSEEGTINAFSEHIPRLKHLGVDLIWLMPIHPISETKRKGNLGSYYAVSDYLEVNPEYGTKQDLINLIDKIHAYGMKVILDWVPNHTGWDHRWIKNHPDFYTKDSTGNITDPLNKETGESNGWTDVADLNYDNSELQDSMIASLKHWVKYYNIDGYRMDVAYEVPDIFWDQAMKELKAIRSDLFFLAESNKPSHRNSKNFHATYGWELHHLMNDVANAKKKFGEFYTLRQKEDSLFQHGLTMNFITNHDENSWKGSEYERMGDAYQAFAVFSHFLDGIPLIYNGQEEPLKRKLKFFDKDNINFDKFQASRFYRDLIQLKKNNQALWNGDYGGPLQLLGKDEDVFIAKREKNGDIVFTILNLSDQEQKITIDEPIINFKDIFKRTQVNYPNGSEVILKPWEFILAVPSF